MNDGSMDPGQRLFLAALDLPPERRDNWLIEQCAGDDDLLQEVRLLLRHDRPSADPLERGLDKHLLPRDDYPQPEEPGMQVRCPHCRFPIEIVDEQKLEDVICGSCGSNFGLISHHEATSTDTVTDKQISHFQLEERVGVGAFGTVFRARDTQLDRVVAVKVPRKRGLSAEEAEKFLREARAAAQLRHTNIVNVHEVGRDGDTLYIVSDFVDGMTLAEWMTAERLTPIEAARLCVTIAEALHHAHEQGVIHRDLKPSNIMLERNGRPHVMDFGLAKREAGEITMTLDGQVLGTPAYMPPEQARGEGHQVDRRADVYSLGVVLYELLSGELPFRGNTQMLLHQLLREEPRSPRRYDTTIPRDVETICMKCLEKDPSRRYQTAADLADDLRRFANGEAVQARPIGRAARGWRWCRRNPVVAGLLAVVAFSLLGGTVVSTYFAIDADRERDNALDLADEKDRLARDKSRFADAADKARRRAQMSQVEAEFTRERDAFNSGQNGLGLMSLARALNALPDGESEREESLRRGLTGWFHGSHRLETAIEHSGFVRHAEFSPDGNRIVAVLSPTLIKASSVPYTVRIWDSTTGEPLGPPIEAAAETGKRGWVPRFRFDYGGHRVAVGLRDGRVVLHDLKDGRKLMETKASAKAARSIAFNKTGSRLVTTCADDFVREWDARSGQLVRELPHPIAVRARYADEDRSLVTIGAAGNVRVWNTETGKQRLEEFHVGKVLDISRSGRRLLTMANVKEQRNNYRISRDFVRLWDLTTGKQLGPDRPYVDGGARYDPFFSPGDRYFFTVYRSNRQNDVYEFSICDVETGKLVCMVKTPRATDCAAFSPNDQMFALGTIRGFAMLFDVTQRKAVGSPLLHETQITNIQFSHDNRFLLSSSNQGETRLWETGSGTPVGQPIRFAAYPDLDSRSILGPRAERIMVADQKHRLLVLRRARHLDHAIQLGSAEPADFLLSPDRRRAVVFSRDLGAQMWDLAKRTPIGPPFRKITSVVRFTPDGKNIVAISDGHQVVVDLETRRRIATIPQPDRRHTVFAISEDLRFAILMPKRGYRRSSVPPTWTFIDTSTGAPVESVPPDLQWLKPREALSTRSERFWLRTRRESVEVWDLTTREQVGEKLAHPARNGKSTRIVAARFLPGTERFATFGYDNQVRLWDAATGQAVGEAMPHEAKLQRHWMTLSPNLKSFVTVTDDFVAHVWDATTGRRIGKPLVHLGAVSSVAFSHDGRTILTASKDRSVQMWDARSGNRVGRSMRHDFRLLGAQRNGFYRLRTEFSPDGRYILTTANLAGVRTIRLWDRATQREIMPMISRHQTIGRTEFTAEGDTIILSGPRGVRLLPIPKPISGSAEEISLKVAIATQLDVWSLAPGMPLSIAEWKAKRRELSRRVPLPSE